MLAHFLGPKSENAPDVILQMKAYEIELMGTHSLLSFHLGFSIMTGLFMITIGMLLLLHSKKIDGSILRTLIFFITVSLITSIIYFHILAYGLILVGLIFLVVAYFKKLNN
ncbi:LIC_13387 family protein [Ekhidna sp.]|uniref:LIC_13387 family protein n=1 Tax=Ekhidna sp. TaxID=2608089 RepID=UPI003C7BDCEE